MRSKGELIANALTKIACVFCIGAALFLIGKGLYDWGYRNGRDDALGRVREFAETFQVTTEALELCHRDMVAVVVAQQEEMEKLGVQRVALRVGGP